MSLKSVLWLKEILSPTQLNSIVKLREALIIGYAQKIKLLAIFGPIILIKLLRRVILKILLPQYPAVLYSN